MDPAWIVALTALAGVITGFLAWLLRRAAHVTKRANQFLEDWNGVPGDSGHEPRLGAMERMMRLEQGLADVQAQVHLNGGRSMRDAVMRTEAAVANNTDQLNAVKQIVDELKAR